MMLMSVSRLFIVSSLSLLFALFLTHIPRILVLETVKALSVFGKGDSMSIFGCGKNLGTDTQLASHGRLFLYKYILRFIFVPADESTVRLTTASRALARCE